MVYYRFCFHMEGITPNEGLVYSALLSHTLMSSECFTADGKFSLELAKSVVEDQDGFIYYYPLPINRLANHLEMTRISIRKILESLKKKHLLTADYIACSLETLDSGYIDLPSKTGLKGQQLVFYGLLKDRSAFYHGVIDTWAYKLAELAGISKKDVYNLLSILHKKGFVERLDNGKLRVK